MTRGDRDLELHIGEAFALLATDIVGYVLLNCKTYGQVPPIHGLEHPSRQKSTSSRGVLF